MLYRKKYIDLLRQLLTNSKDRYFAIVWPHRIGKSTFLRECEQFDIFWSSHQYQHIEVHARESLREKTLKKGITTIIIDSQGSIDFSDIRSFIEPLSSDIRVIFIVEQEIVEEGVSLFHLPTISLREYLEHEHGELQIGDILSGNIDISKLNLSRDLYIKRGGYPEPLLEWTGWKKLFEEKRWILYSELYEKEYSIFDSYLRTIAMNIGNLFKADQIAKLLGISRRKVNKYTEIALKYDIVKAIGPWVQDAAVETSRHVKLYFSDLWYLSVILWEIHGEGTLKQGTIENLIFLELIRKLEGTHMLYFYRKKSWADITYIAENTENTLITPIEVTVRASDVTPQVFRAFDDEYHARVERYMICNDSKSGISSINDTQIMILPHIGI